MKAAETNQNNEQTRKNVRQSIMPKQKKPINTSKSTKSKNNNIVYVSTEQTPNTRVYATKSLNINNRIVYTGLNLFSMIGLNISVIKGGLVKYRAFEGLQYVDEYLKTLISNVNQSIKDEIKTCDEHLNHFKKQGYEFVNDSRTSKCEFKLFTNAAAELIQTYALLDELITKINFLEKCDHFQSITKVTLERQWMSLPKDINSRVIALQKKLEGRFDINLKRAKQGTKQIDKDKLRTLLQQSTKSRGKISTMKFETLPEFEQESISESKTNNKPQKKDKKKASELEEF